MPISPMEIFSFWITMQWCYHTASKTIDDSPLFCEIFSQFTYGQHNSSFSFWLHALSFIRHIKYVLVHDTCLKKHKKKQIKRSDSTMQYAIAMFVYRLFCMSSFIFVLLLVFGTRNLLRFSLYSAFNSCDSSLVLLITCGQLLLFFVFIVSLSFFVCFWFVSLCFCTRDILQQDVFKLI